MLHTGTLLRAELYNDYTGKSSVVTVYNANKGKHPGKLIVTNGHWWDPGPKPCGNYKVDNKVLSTEDWMDWGFGWNTGSLPMMVATMGNDNYVSTLPVLLDGKEHNNSLNNDTSGVRRSTLRTWFGVDAAGKWTVEVTTSYYTLTEITKRMLSLGIVDGMVLDGSGSSQWYDGKTRLKGDGRAIYQYLLLWFADEGGTEDEDDNKEDDNTATYKKGIDVSQWQGTIDWDKVKASGVQFAMLRAGWGQNNIDTQFVRNISECNRVGIPCGIYWFSYAYTEAMAVREAEYALAAVEPYKLDYPIAFDYEGDSVRYAKTKGVTPNKAHVSALARAFCGRIEQGGYYAMVYTNPAYLSQYFDADIPKEFDIWLAQWPTNPDPATKPAQAGGIWQYTSSGTVSGISGRVDLDAAYYDYPGIIAENGLNQPAAPPEPEPVPEPDPETPAKTETQLAREWAMATGISDGTNPSEPCTREQAWVMLYRMNNGGNAV